MEFGFSYNRRDLILYALSIGLGNSTDGDDDEAAARNEQRFLYERHAAFSALPTFCLTFTFLSNLKTSDTSAIPPFPSPLMTRDSLIPKRFLRDKNFDLSKFPVIHTQQSIVWHNQMPIPAAAKEGQACSNRIYTKLRGKGLETISVVPKAVGTFVTVESFVTQDQTKKNTSYRVPICSMRQTILIAGVSPEKIIPYQASKPEQSSPSTSQKTPRIIKIPRDDNVPPLLEFTYPTAPTQALLYRLASGDSNQIHVDDSASRLLGSDTTAPLLHGLCTLGIAVRALLRVVPDADTSIRSLDVKFTQPVFVGDVLTVRIWKKDASSSSSSSLVFDVIKKDPPQDDTEAIVVVDGGQAVFDRPILNSKL